MSKMVTDQDREEQTPLHLAVEGGDLALAKLCLDKGANVNAHKVNMTTPLHLAATVGDLEIVKMLIEHDANIEAKNAVQETPLHRAALFNRVEILDYLLSRLVCTSAGKCKGVVRGVEGSLGTGGPPRLCKPTIFRWHGGGPSA